MVPYIVLRGQQKYNGHFRNWAYQERNGMDPPSFASKYLENRASPHSKPSVFQKAYEFFFKKMYRFGMWILPVLKIFTDEKDLFDEKLSKNSRISAII